MSENVGTSGIANQCHDVKLDTCRALRAFASPSCLEMEELVGLPSCQYGLRSGCPAQDTLLGSCLRIKMDGTLCDCATLDTLKSNTKPRYLLQIQIVRAARLMRTPWLPPWHGKYGNCQLRRRISLADSAAICTTEHKETTPLYPLNATRSIGGQLANF